MTEPSPASASRSARSFWSRRSGVVLLMSLALNLVVIGAIAGTAFVHSRGGGGGFGMGGFADPDAGPGGFGGPRAMGGFMRTLPAARRDELRRAFFAERPRLWPLRRQLQQVRSELAGHIEAERLDRPAVEGAMQRLLVAEGELRRAQLALMGEMIAKLTPEERRAFVAWRRSMEQGFGFGFGRRGHGGPGPGGPGPGP